MALFHASGDLIDLSAVDAIDGGGDNAFTFIASGAFAGLAGQLHYVAGPDHVRIQGDINGDRVADFSVVVLGMSSLSSGDFIR